MPRHYKNNSDDGLPDQKNKDPLDPNPTAKSPISDGSDDKGQKAFDPRLSSLAELPNVVLPTTSGSDGGDDQLKAEDEEQDQAAVVAAAFMVGDGATGADGTEGDGATGADDTEGDATTGDDGTEGTGEGKPPDMNSAVGGLNTDDTEADRQAQNEIDKAIKDEGRKWDEENPNAGEDGPYKQGQKAWKERQAAKKQAYLDDKAAKKQAYLDDKAAKRQAYLDDKAKKAGGQDDDTGGDTTEAATEEESPTFEWNKDEKTAKFDPITGQQTLEVDRIERIEVGMIQIINLLQTMSEETRSVKVRSI